MVRPREFRGFLLHACDEVRTDPDLGVYTLPETPSLSEEIATFSGSHQRVVRGETVGKVAVVEGRVVGAGDVRPRGNHIEDRLAGVLAIGIHPEWRGKGLGDRRMGALLESCRGRFDLVLLTVTEISERGRRLYRNHGFEEWGRTSRTFQRGGRVADEILLWRPVEPPGA